MECHILPAEIRVTLSAADVQQLTDEALVEQTLELGPEESRRLTIAVEAREDVGALGVTGNADRIAVAVPRDQLNDWARSSREALSDTQPSARGQRVRITLERRERPGVPEERKGEEWFDKAVRRAAEEDERRHVGTEQISTENGPASDI